MIGQLILISLVALTTVSIFGVHTVDEGYIGLYKTFGVLSPKFVAPGLHVLVPYIQSVELVQVSVQTDVVKNIPCGTSGGILVSFQKIEVVNRLKKNYAYDTIKNYTKQYDRYWIYDKIHHEINQFCSKHTLQNVYIDMFETLDEELIKALQKDINTWAPGIEILSIRITKPKIPEQIRANYQMIEQTKVQYMITSQNQKVRLEKEKTKLKQDVIVAESELEVKLIGLKKNIEQKKNELKMAKIQAQIELENEKTITDTNFLNIVEEIKLNPKYLTHQFLLHQGIHALTNNLDLYLGDNIPYWWSQKADKKKLPVAKSRKNSQKKKSKNQGGKSQSKNSNINNQL